MIEFKHVVVDPLGLHGRPASKLVKLVQQLDSVVTIYLKNSSADATSIIRVMSLGAVTGTEITILIEGGNEQTSFQKLKEFFEDNL